MLLGFVAIRDGDGRGVKFSQFVRLDNIFPAVYPEVEQVTESCIIVQIFFGLGINFTHYKFLSFSIAQMESLKNKFILSLL